MIESVLNHVINKNTKNSFKMHKVVQRPCSDVTSARSPSRFLPCWGRGRSWRLGGRKESKESFQKAIKEWGNGPGFHRPSGNKHPQISLAAEFICHRTGAGKNVDQSSAEREQGHPDQDGVDQRHNAATSWLLYHPWRHFILHHPWRWERSL